MMTFKPTALPVVLAPTGADDVARLGRGRVWARAAWFVVAAVALALLLASIPQYILLIGVVTEQEQAIGALVGSPLLMSPSPAFEFWVDVVYHLLSFFCSALCLALAALILHRKGDERMAFVISLTLLLFGVIMTGPVEMLVGQRTAGQSVAFAAQMLLWAFILFLFYLFPDGRFVPPWTRWLALLLIPWGIGMALFQMSNPLFTDFFPFMVLYTVPSLTAPLAQIYRYRRVSNAVECQQTKWVIFGFSAWILAGTAITAGLVYLARQFGGGVGAEPPFWSMLFMFAERLLWPLSLLFVPISLTFAIFKYRLFDIDVILNRALVYGSLTAFVIAAYVLIVGAFGAVFQTNATVAPVVLATVIVGLLMRPLHGGLQRTANRWIHAPARAPEPFDVPPSPAGHTSRRARWLLLARAVWVVSFVLAAMVLLISLPGYIGIFTSPGVRPVDAPPLFAAVMPIVTALTSVGTVVLCMVLSVVIFWRKRDETMALLTCLFLLAYGIAWGGALEIALGAFESEARRILANTLGSTLTITVSTLLLFLFPNGRFVPGWTRWLVLATLPVVPLLFFFFYLSPDSLASPLAPAIEILFMSLVVVGVAVQVHRYRHVSTGAERQQTKWFAYSLGLSFGLAALSGLAYPIILSTPAGAPLPWWAPVAQLGWILAVAIIPLSLTIAVLRYRLWDIDLLVNRALLYGALTASVVGIFILIVAVLGALFQTSGNLVISLLATAAVAVLFQPLRERVQRGVNRLLYGERDDPYAVIARLGQRLEATLAPDAVLPTIVETVAQALKVPYVGIALVPGPPSAGPPAGDGADGDEMVAEYGKRVGKQESLPLLYQNERIGELVVSPRPGDALLSPADRHLLETIADQAAIAAHAARLTTDLQHSRERLVTAREEERRRIRRDLHDGLGPALASMTLQLDAALNALQHDPQTSAQLLVDLKNQTREALTDIRRLVYALRPPALDELGLLGALREHIEHYPSSNRLEITMDLPPQLPALTAAVEVAVYRIVTEALTNVVKHSNAAHCTVRLAVMERELEIEIQDDGDGFRSAARLGVGVTSMRERASELGGTFSLSPAGRGGTRVVARLPLTNG